MRLNLGAGEMNLTDWNNVDLPDVDLSLFPWPWDNGAVDEILASHVLEHFTRQDGFHFLRECHRILRPGGVLHVAVPDMDKFIDCRLAGDFSPLSGYAWTDLNYFMGGDGSEKRAPYRHRYMYSWASLAWMMTGAGFDVQRRREPAPFDNLEFRAISLYVDGLK